MTASLVLAGQFELLGGGVKSKIPACAGAIFRLAPGFDLSAPQPTSSIVASLVLDGELPVGGRSSDRQPTLPIAILAPDMDTLAAARETLVRAIAAEQFTLVWTRDTPTAQPLVLDCYRAQPTVVDYSLIRDKYLVSTLTVTFLAQPFGRSDVPEIVQLQTPLAGMSAPPNPITIDSFATEGNLLSRPAATFDDGTVGGWTPVSGCTIAPSTSQKHSGTHSLALTATGTGTMSAQGPTGVNGFPVRAGQVIDWSVWMRANTIARGCVAGMNWYDVNGVPLTPSLWFPTNDTTSAFTFMTVPFVFVAPADGYATPTITVQSPGGAGEIHFFDDFTMSDSWGLLTLGPGGTSAHWDPDVYGDPTGQGSPVMFGTRQLGPLDLMMGWAFSGNGNQIGSTVFGATIANAAKVTVGDQFQWAPNLLYTAASGSVHNSDFETSIGTYVNRSNATLALDSAHHQSGVNSLSMSSIAAGDMSARHCNSANFATQMLAVVPGQQVYAGGSFRAATSGRSCQIAVDFFDAVGGSLGALFGTAVNDNTAGWTLSTDGGAINAPAGAAWAAAVPIVHGTGAAAEFHYVDDVWLAVALPAIYTVQNITAPFLGGQQLQFTPPLVGGAFAQSTDVAVQVGPVPQLASLTFWAGFGSTAFYPYWGLKAAGPVTFGVTLYDLAGRTATMSRTQQVHVSNSSSAPVWQKIRVAIPDDTGLDFSNIVGYSIQAAARPAGDLPYADVYLSQLLAAAPTWLAPVNPASGAVYDLTSARGSARSEISLQFQQTGTQSVTQQIKTAGGGQWQAGPGTSSVTPVLQGAGGNGSTVQSGSGRFGGGGAGAGSSAPGAQTVTPRGISTFFIPAGGSGQDCTFTTDLGVTSTAHSGGNAPANSATGGTAGAAGTGGFAGGAGGGGASPTGGGGGGSAGSSGAGGAGQIGSSGGAGGTAGSGGGAKGGHGKVTVAGASIDGLAPGAGGGGGQDLGTGRLPGGKGANGQITLTYTQSATFKTLLVHRPGNDAPDTLCPWVPLDPDSVPDGSVEFPVPSLVLGQNARFGSTYTPMIVNSSWHSPSASRTVTLTINHYEQGGGVVYTTTVTRTLTPNALQNPENGPIIRLPEITLPDHAIPADNSNAYFTVTVTDTDTSDRFQDVLFLDTLGSTVSIQSPTAYTQYWIDEPLPGKDVGQIMGSVFDRADAVSVLAYAVVSGPPLHIDPDGSTALLVYCGDSGLPTPAAQMIYSPRWMLERL